MTTRTLLIRLAGPQQAWGSRSRFATRGTERAPTRSGVLGLVAAALGMERTASLELFDDLAFGVRIDQPGTIERDFQTARTLDGASSMPLSERYYLADAVFLAGLESNDNELLDRVFAALRRPHYPLFLGRRAFPPAGPLRVWIVEAPLRTALDTADWQASKAVQDRATDAPVLDILVDALPGEPVEQTLADIPRSFDPRRRMHGLRDITLLRQQSRPSAATRAPLPHHDPLLLVSDEEV